MRKTKLRHAGALVHIVIRTRLSAALAPRLDRNEDVVLAQRAVEQRDANQAVLQFTARKRRARAAVLGAASVAVANRGVAAVLVVAALGLLAVGNRRLAHALVARRRLRRVRRAALTSATALVLAEVDRAVLVLLAHVHLDHTALVQLRAADRARLTHPSLRIAVAVTVVAADRSERKLERVVEARAASLQHNNLIDNSSGLDLERRTRLGVKERQRHVLALRLHQVARHTQARSLLRRAQAVSAVHDLARLHNAESTILQDVAQFVGKFPAVVRQLSETARHGEIPPVVEVLRRGFCTGQTFDQVWSRTFFTQKSIHVVSAAPHCNKAKPDKQSNVGNVQKNVNLNWSSIMKASIACSQTVKDLVASSMQTWQLHRSGVQKRLQMLLQSRIS